MSDPAMRLVAQRFPVLAKLAAMIAQPVSPLGVMPQAMPNGAPPQTTPTVRPLASLFPQTPPTSGLKATGLPGLPGRGTTNVIDQMGGLDAAGQVVDGNFGAGVRKGAATKKAGEDDVFASDPAAHPMRGWQWKALKRDEAEQEQGWLPRIFTSESTPLVEMLASPARQGLLHALAGGAAGATAGYFGGPSAGAQPLHAALTGGGLGALLSGAYGYGKRRRENDRITDALRRTPPGATVGDYEQLQQQDAAGRVKLSLSTPGSSLSQLLSRLGGALKPVGREVAQTGAGAAAGYGLTAAERASGYADPNMSAEGQTGLAAANMSLGAALANPRSRNFLLNRRVLSPVANHPDLFARAPSSRFARPLGLGSLAIAAPRLAATADAGQRTLRRVNDVLTNNPQLVDTRIREWTDPAHIADNVLVPRARELIREQVNRLITSPQATDAARVFSHSIGTNLAGSLGGGLIGGTAGHFLGNALLPDDETATHQSRQNRGRLRSLVSMLGSLGGGVGGVYLANKFTPTPTLAASR